jgi:hypothetical protein
VKTAFQMTVNQPTIVVGEDTDLLVLFLYHVTATIKTVAMKSE